MMAIDVICNADTNQMTTFVMVAYDLGGITIKSTRLNVQLVKVVATLTTPSVSMAHGTAAGSFDGDLTTMDNLTPNKISATVDTSALGQDAARGLVGVTVLVPKPEPAQRWQSPANSFSS